jgi:serine/threonine protein kinase
MSLPSESADHRDDPQPRSLQRPLPQRPLPTGRDDSAQGEEPDHEEDLPDSSGICSQEEGIETDVTVLASSSPASSNPIYAETFPVGLTSQELAYALRGEMLDHFHLQEMIGGGGMGIVFRARDTTLDRNVAVKVIASPRVQTEDLQRRYLIEAQSTARLDHPNIAGVHFIGHARGLPYIVFEYIDGVNLRQLVRQKGPLLLSEALSYTYQIAHALAHAWRRDVVHRDVKPSNILITREGQAKLVDMGLARLQQVDGSTADELTETGVTLGTFDYISPEQARDPRSADTRSDIYSLGCTLYFMLVGRPPFAEGNMMQKLLQHQDVKPPELRALRGDIPDEISDLVSRMLAKVPADRFQTPFELVAELASIMGEHEIELPHSLGPLATLTSRRRVTRWKRIAPWVIPLLVMLAAGLWMEYADKKAAETSFEFPELQPSMVENE